MSEPVETSPSSRRAYAWVGALVDLVLILVGLWMISRGWTVFGEVVVVVSLVGLVVSAVALLRARR